MQKLRERITYLLAAVEKSARAASLDAGLSERFLSNILDEKTRSINAESAEKLAPILNSTPEWIAFGRGEVHPSDEALMEVHDIWDAIEDRDKRRVWLETGRALGSKDGTND